MSPASTASVVPPPPDLEGVTAVERIRWAVERFGERLILTTSFGIQSAVMLHLVTRQRPNIPVVFIDTGYLFPETYRFAAQLTERLNLNLKVYQPRVTAARQEALFGKRWEQGPEELDRYNLLNKVEPMDRAVRELRRAAGGNLRRSQSSTRENRPVLQVQQSFQGASDHPDWDNRDVHRYVTEREPRHTSGSRGMFRWGLAQQAPLAWGCRRRPPVLAVKSRSAACMRSAVSPDFQI